MSKSEQIRKKNYAGRGPFLVPPKSCKDPDLVDLSKVFENHPKYNEDLLNEFETLGARVVITAYYDDIISGNGVDKEVYEATLLNSTPAEKCFKDFCSAISSIGDTNILKAQAIYIRLTQCKSVEAIAPDLPKSPTQTNRYLREMYKKMRTDEFKQSLREYVLNYDNVVSKNVELKKDDKNPLMEFIIKPINDIDICNQILRDCELYDNVLAITSNNSEISEIVSILFTYVSESIAVGTKMTYLNNTAEEIAAFKRDNGLSVKSPTPKSFKHNKRSFISTVKSNKEFILAQIKVNFEPTLESVHKNPETTSTEENNNIEVNSEPSNKRSFFHRIFKKRK